MGYRIHTADSIAYTEKPDVYFDDDEMAVGPSLVLDDKGNLEAFVIPGTPEQIRRFGQFIIDEADAAAAHIAKREGPER